MAHVVTGPCSDCGERPCVAVCPNDCFHQGDQMLYIHPANCIDCSACVPECPVDAIFHEKYLPMFSKPFRDLNVTLASQSERIRRAKR